MAEAVGVAMDKKKTIAFYIGDLGKGGAERVMTNLARHFREQGYTVYLVTKTVSDSEYEVPEGVTRIVADITCEEETKSRILNLCKRVAKLRRIWKDIKPDAIVSFIRKNNIMAIASSRLMHIPVLVSVRTDPRRELEGIEKATLFAFRFADGIICQTTQASDYFPDYLRKKIVILPNSLTKQFIRDEYVPKSKKEIVTVGRMDNYKNQDLLLDVFEDIKNSYPDWSLHIYGEGERYDTLTSKYTGERIYFHGQVNDVAGRIEDSKIFVLPSDNEGMPNALIEAMALGLACISTDCPVGGPADIIEDGVNGYLIPVKDKEKLKERLIELLDSEEKRISLGKNSLKIGNTLSPDNVNKQWQDYVESFIK